MQFRRYTMIKNSKWVLLQGAFMKGETLEILNEFYVFYNF